MHALKATKLQFTFYKAFNSTVAEAESTHLLLSESFQRWTMTQHCHRLMQALSLKQEISLTVGGKEDYHGFVRIFISYGHIC